MLKLRELESNQRPPGSEPGVTTNSNCSASIALSTTPSTCPGSQARGEGFEPGTARRVVQPASKAGGLPLADPQECPAGVEPASPGWKPGAFAARPRARCCKRKERESNPQGLTLDRFRSGCHHLLACPSVYQAAEAGIEPATKRLTAALPYQHGTHRNR